MRQLEKNLIGQMLREQDGPFSTTGGTQVKALAREWPEVVMPAFGVRAADARDALEIVATGAKPLPDLLDTLKAIPAVGGGVLLLVVLAEVGEMAFKDGMKSARTTGNVPVRRHGRDRDCRTHINIYGRNELPASDTWLFHRSPHNKTHSPDAFSELSLLRGRRRCASLYGRFALNENKRSYILTSHITMCIFMCRG